MSATGADMFRELEDDLQGQHPGLRNIHVASATPTGDYDTRIQPYRRCYAVTYTADGE
jgi:hypothetical protein